MTEKTITIGDLLAVVNKLPADQFAVFEAGFRAMQETKREIKRSQARAFLNPGDRVTFDAKTRGVKVGLLLKVNSVTAKVQVEEKDWSGAVRKVTWTVPLTILKKA